MFFGTRKSVRMFSTKIFIIFFNKNDFKYLIFLSIPHTRFEIVMDSIQNETFQLSLKKSCISTTFANNKKKFGLELSNINKIAIIRSFGFINIPKNGYQ